MTESLDVMLWGRRVGTLVMNKSGYKQEICFYFDEDYVENGGYDIAPLRAPIGGNGVRRGLPIYAEREREFGGLMSFIADSMPDYWGNVVFDEWVRMHKIRSRDLSPLDRLAYIGRRGMGALEYVPPISGEMETPFKVELDELSRFAQHAMNEAMEFRVMISGDFMIESLFRVGTSAGGRRPKAVVNVNFETGECYSGQVASPTGGFTPMIVKFDEHGEVPTTRIEYSYYLMAQDAGMRMMGSRLMEGEMEAHFLTERFDRDGGEKVHVQTLAAMNPVSTSYEDLFDVAFKLGVGREEMRQLFLQMVMNVAGCNVDDHNKNFSFMMRQDGVWHVAPAYDFTFSVDVSAPFYVNRHSLTVNGKNRDVGRGDLLEVAKRFNVKGASEIVDRVCRTVGNYGVYGGRAGVSEDWIARIEREIEGRLKALG